MWTQIFKAGEHTDRAGNRREWSDADLDKIVKLYNERDTENTHTAPVVVGHPAADKPAYGWVEKLRKAGKYLEAKFRDVDAAFAELVNAGRYRTISIALYPDLRLRHIGFLGATPPAVKGLKEPTFEDVDGKIIQIETEKEIIRNNEKREFSMDNEMLSGLIAFAKSKFGAEVAAELESYVAGKNPAPQKNEKPQNKKTDSEMSESKSKTAPAKIEHSESSAENMEMKRRIDALETENREMRFNEYFKSQLESGRLVISQRDAVRSAFGVAERSGEFSDADGGNAIKSLIESFPKRVEFGEFAVKSDAPGDDADLAAQSEWIVNYYKGDK